MKHFWNQGAKENPYYWVMTGKKDWEKDEFYAEGKRHVAELVIPFLQEHNISPEESKRMTFLDIGCGTGRMTVQLHPLFRTVIGTDVSEEMIERAKIDHKNSQVQFYTTSGKDLECIASSSIDVAFSYAVYQHVDTKSALVENLTELHRVLRTGGVAKIECRGYPGNPPGKVVWFTSFERFYVAIVLWRNFIPIPFIRFFTPLYGVCIRRSELHSILSKMGFRSVRVYSQGLRHLWVEVVKVLVFFLPTIIEGGECCMLAA